MRSPNLESGTKPSLDGTTSTASRRRGGLSASLIHASTTPSPRRDVMSISTSPRTAGPRAKFGFLLLGSIAGIMAAGGASAARLDSDAPSVVVKYSEQSLATDDGVYALYRPITAAARQVCPDAWTRDLRRKAQAGRSQNEANTPAVRQLRQSP